MPNDKITGNPKAPTGFYSDPYALEKYERCTDETRRILASDGDTILSWIKDYPKSYRDEMFVRVVDDEMNGRKR